jgi:hypothetical protein
MFLFRRTILSVALLHLGSRLSAQSDYRNLDGGRPVRVEDATATPRHELEWDAANLRAERINGQFTSVQIEPRLAYGAWPRLELKMRAPLVWREKGLSPRAGLVGVGLGAFYNMKTESHWLPALAIEGESLISAAAASTPGTTYAGRVIATRSFSLGRVHANAGIANYRVALPPPPPPTVIVTPPVLFPDVPCNRLPETPREIRPTVRCAGRALARVDSGVGEGKRTFVGVAVDKTFPLRSLMIVGDVYAERYTGILKAVDWTAELGVRRQFTPRAVVNAAVGRRFSGNSRAWFVSAGATMSYAFRMFISETR